MTLYFFYRTVLFYALTHIYLFWHLRPLWRDHAPGRWFARFYFACMGLFPLLFLSLPPDGAAQRLFGRAGGAWQTLAYFGLLAFLFLDALRLRDRLWRRFFSGSGPRREEPPLAENCSGRFSFPLEGLPRSMRRPALIAIALGALIFAYGLHEAGDPRLTSLEVLTDKLPPGVKRLRLAFVSDLHVSPRLGGEALSRVVDMILARKPDCILLGGDILDDALQGTPDDFRELGRLRAPLGAFAVLGNHEAFGRAGRPAAKLRQAGINVLAGQEARPGPLRIIGVDDPRVSAQKGGFSHDPMPLLRQAAPERFTLLLDHRPSPRPESLGLFDLQLSGHSHGGQIFILEPLLRARFGAPSGLSAHGSDTARSLLFITTGAGYSKLPIRLFVPPEVVIIDLLPSQTK